ncbi:MAG: PD40 domain-containing protein [Candidatus Omnitrophica bacterium]|nr:PD40 domain-containing protein [Candidatus Omnitrophota bacterium]
MHRRDFLMGLSALSLLAREGRVAWGESAAQAETSSPFEEYLDSVTGARVRILTNSPSKDQVVYQTHPQWTPGMSHLVFTSDRSGGMLPHSVDMKTGGVRCLVEPGSGSFALARKEDRLYYQNGHDLWMTRVDTPQSVDLPRTRISGLPKGIDGIGEMTIDCDEDRLYCRTEIEKDKRWGIFALDIASGEWKKVTECDFQIGHIQANPYVPGLIMFCWETGGDAPQRMWRVHADGTDKRPFYKETYNEWVTHEVWWKPDRAVFTIWPYDEEHLEKPHGVASADLETGELTIHSQYRAWHTHGSPDGKWLMGDDFDRNLWLIDATSGERRLLTQGHLGKKCTTHPHASFTPDSQSIVFASSHGGNDDIYLVDLPEWETLPKPE